MYSQWDGISLIGPCWFSVLCNDGIMSLRDEQSFFLHLTPVQRRPSSPVRDKNPTEVAIERKAKQADVMGLKARVYHTVFQGQVAAATFVSGQFIRPNDGRLL